MDIIIAIAILGGLGLIFGLVLAAASKVFYVETDPRLDQLNECLPGANCGGCGYAGCGGYAEAVLNGEAKIGLCASGGSECAKAMGAIMGVKVEDVARKVALVRCSGYRSVDAEGNEKGARMKAEYEGFRDCLAASKVGGNGPLACKFGCLGFGGGFVLVPLYLQTFVGEAAQLLQIPAEEFSNLMALTQATPGPVSVNAATFFGYRMAGVAGAAVATTALLLPSYFLL